MNMYWNVYRGLEKELLALADVITINDQQKDVYSVKIASLLLRTAVEIESVSKKLYKMNGGEKDSSQALFDVDCIGMLNQLWRIEHRFVTVSSPYIYLGEENRTFAPLKNCSKMGDGTWKKAYQAVKHDRENNLERGNVLNLIKALGALCILNIYLMDETVELGADPFGTFDCSRGSEIFSLHVDRQVSYDNNGNAVPGIDSDHCTYIIHVEQTTLDKVNEAVSQINGEIAKRTMMAVRDRVDRGESLSEEDVKRVANDLMVPTARENYRILHEATQGLRYIAELNKANTAV